MRVGVRLGVCGVERLVADVVVGMREEVCADLRRDDFAAVVVGEGGGNGRDARCPSGGETGCRSRRRAGPWFPIGSTAMHSYCFCGDIIADPVAKLMAILLSGVRYITEALRPQDAFRMFFLVQYFALMT